VLTRYKSVKKLYTISGLFTVFLWGNAMASRLLKVQRNKPLFLCSYKKPYT